jgi:hypothetical protein
MLYVCYMHFFSRFVSDRSVFCTTSLLLYLRIIVNIMTTVVTPKHHICFIIRNVGHLACQEAESRGGLVPYLVLTLLTLRTLLTRLALLTLLSLLTLLTLLSC